MFKAQRKHVDPVRNAISGFSGLLLVGGLRANGLQTFCQNYSHKFTFVEPV